ncbi:MAG: hypothetical protein KatS3mg026_1076 [Bacteroidia bacterium]|nr:MAG: hypothetical protein KatS3mg026_1076 [Bacteroidia bacterium]
MPLRAKLYAFLLSRVFWAVPSYIALLREDPHPWPLDPGTLGKEIRALERSQAWEKIWDRDGLVIFRRRPQR